MTNIKIFKKLTAFLLAFMMTISVIPLEIVFANYQNPVPPISNATDSAIAISDQSLAGDAYSMLLSWAKPTLGKDDDSLPTGTHIAESYTLTYKNTTKSDTRTQTVTSNKDANNTGEQFKMDFAKGQLLSGSLYSFTVAPVAHTNSYETDAVLHTIVQKPAPLDTTVKAGIDSLYLTDIAVSASGEGSELTVKWDEPTFNGVKVFEGYNINYYGAPPIVGKTVYVSTKDAKSIVNNQLEYTITDSSLLPGVFYTVKIEPLYLAPGSTKPEELRTKTISPIKVGTSMLNIAYTDPTKREYMDNNVFVKPSLDVKADGLTDIILTWSQFPLTNAKGEKITRLEIRNVDNTSPLATIHGDFAASDTTWRGKAPDKTTTYQVVAYYGDEEPMATDAKTFYPSSAKFKPYMPTILDIYDVAKTAPNYELVVDWKAFVREPYNAAEKLLVRTKPTLAIGKFVDKEMKYNVWITDNLANFSNGEFAPLYVESVKASELTERADKNNGTPYDDVAYTRNFKDYYTLEGAQFVKKAITENKVYYVKIQAVRDPGGDESKFDATGSWFIAPKSDIGTTPNMMGRPPLRVKKTGGIDQITEKTVEIEWDTSWLEVYNTTDENDKNWYSKIGVKADGTLVFGDAADNLPIANGTRPVLLLNNVTLPQNATPAEKVDAIIKGLLAINPAANATTSTIIQRTIELERTDGVKVEYELHVVKFDDMYDEALKDTSYTEYINAIIADETKWETVVPSGDLSIKDYVVATLLGNGGGVLEPNTPYAIFMRPFYTIDGKKVAYYPNYVTATTLDVRAPIDIEPTIPFIEPVLGENMPTDTSITLWWGAISDGLTYEIEYAETPNATGKDRINIPYADIIKTATKVVKTNDPHKGETGLQFAVLGLFPDTEYYFWVRAVAENTSGTAYSQWSNPVSQRTKDIAAPDAPKGLGPAALDSIKEYNLETKATISGESPDYMVIEWNRDYFDLNNLEQAKETNADAVTVTGGKAEGLFAKNILSTFMIKIDELVANRYYYLRAKTILSISQKEGKTTRQYNYVVQLSKTDKFTDVVEITVPPLDAATGDANSGKFKQKESVWSKTIKLKTGKQTDGGVEYDGDKNPNMYPLPSKDFEETFDAKTSTVTKRFRSNKIGADGLPDNLVDQRFITSLVANKTFSYEIEARAKDTFAINAVVEMPYSIIKALDERKISLKIKSNNATFTIEPNAIQTAQVKALGDVGNSTVQFTLKSNAKGTVALKSNQNFTTLPQKLEVKVITSNKNLTIEQLAKPIKVEMKIENKLDKLSKNVNAYILDANTGGWQVTQSSYNDASGTFTIQATKPANFATIAQDEPFTRLDGVYRDSVFEVTSQINITDMITFDESKPVSAAAFNNLVAAVAYNRATIKINDAMSEADYDNLAKAKLLATGTYVSKEVAINNLVKLYELKTKTAVKGYPTLAEVSIAGAKDTSAAYQISVRKAYYIGFFDLETTFKPKDNLTYGQFIYMIGIILQDKE